MTEPSMSEPEKRARAVASGDQKATVSLFADVIANDREKVLPVLFALRLLQGRPNKTTGEFAFEALKRCQIEDLKLQVETKDASWRRIDAVIVADLVALVALHLPEATSGAARIVFPASRDAMILFETVLALCSTFKNELEWAKNGV